MNIFKVLDTLTGEYLREMPNEYDRNDRYKIVPGRTTIPNKGKVFKRKSDVSMHISANIAFYKHYGDRFAVIEFELTPTSTNPVTVFLYAKELRDKADKLRAAELQLLHKKQEMQRLTDQLDNLSTEVDKLSSKKIP